MSTTDNAIQYDVRFAEHLLPYLELSTAQQSSLKDFVSMGLIQRDRLVEMAIARVGGQRIVSVHGQDFCDGSDAKSVVSVARNNNQARGQWMNSYAIRGVRAKTGPLRIVAYNKLQDQFQYFFVPYYAHQHLSSTLEIVIESKFTKDPDPGFTGLANKSLKWWNYEVTNFEELCQKTA